MTEHATAFPSGLWAEQLRLLLESTGEGIFGVDLDGLCVFINRAGAHMLGYEPSAVLGQNMHELTHHSHHDGRHYPVEDCPIFNAFREGLPCRIDTEVFWNKQGASFPVEYSSYPILDGTTVRGAVVTFVDITERQRVASALKKTKDELELRVVERTQELSAALHQLRELSAYLDTVREDERTRIAREIHDELGSLLVALKMDVNWLDKRLAEQPTLAATEQPSHQQKMRCKCQNMSSLIETAVENVGRIITDLRPSILDHQGLWAALDWQAHEFAQTAELTLDWQIQVDEIIQLPEFFTLSVFRIFQEILSNVGRHARASHLQIRITIDAQQLQLLVKDNGVGAPTTNFLANTAYGVMGMRERVRHLGGTIDIHSQPGAGCQVVVILPLPDNEVMQG